MLYHFLKRVFDIVLSLFALIVLTPVLFIASIGIYISSPGPVLFKAVRIGKNGKPFVMYKLRTMHVNNQIGHIITLRDDNRIFPFGRLLRTSKIDELPQLVNILRGEMSIVGWRPEDIEIANDIYSGRFKQILDTKPGLTSPGSLYDYTHGEKFTNESDYKKVFLPVKLELELYYVNQQSLLYDASLIIRTIKIILLTIAGVKSFEVPKEIEIMKGLE